MVPAALLLGAHQERRARTGQPGVSTICLDGIPCHVSGA